MHKAVPETRSCSPADARPGGTSPFLRAGGTSRYQGHSDTWWTVAEVRPESASILKDRRMAAGWLEYSSDRGERVCVAPIPRGWRDLDTPALEAYRLAGRFAGYSDETR
jgi:hypothetical protein